MFFEIPLKTNFYNFSQSVNLGGVYFTLRFNYSARRETYIMDILSSAGEVLESGLCCSLNTQLNKRILGDLEGVLFFQSADPKISYVDRTNLGTKVKLFYYVRAE